MICPVCKSNMIDVEYNRIELDYCTVCRGVWFDTEELELLIESMGLEEAGLAVDKITDSPEAETSEKGRKVIIDVCRRGDGLWFDGGEVGQLIKQLINKPQARGDSQQQVITFLGEVFGASE